MCVGKGSRNAPVYPNVSRLNIVFAWIKFNYYKQKRRTSSFTIGIEWVSLGAADVKTTIRRFGKVVFCFAIRIRWPDDAWNNDKDKQTNRPSDAAPRSNHPGKSHLYAFISIDPITPPSAYIRPPAVLNGIMLI
jgi:hypothetical protein